MVQPLGTPFEINFEFVVAQNLSLHLLYLSISIMSFGKIYGVSIDLYGTPLDPTALSFESPRSNQLQQKFLTFTARSRLLPPLDGQTIAGGAFRALLVISRLAKGG